MRQINLRKLTKGVMMLEAEVLMLSVRMLCQCFFQIADAPQRPVLPPHLCMAPQHDWAMTVLEPMHLHCLDMLCPCIARTLMEDVQAINRFKYTDD